jgi:uncharacterized caspase-like protein
MNKYKTITVLILILLPYISLSAQNKTALIIGNGTYEHFENLDYPGSEAELMADALQRLDFEVNLVLNASFMQMEDALYDFEEILTKQGGLAFFFTADMPFS